ncbi:MAG: hypothetical protein GX055_06340 [Desulfovibrionales bacterium]|nr:hypothetical protein [Desulfovibrionales bacterium]
MELIALASAYIQNRWVLLDRDEPVVGLQVWYVHQLNQPANHVLAEVFELPRWMVPII